MSTPVWFTDEVVTRLKAAVGADEFVGVSFQDAMKFVLTDGAMPADGLPLDSILRLDDWLAEQRTAAAVFTATELKNKTGTVIAAALRGAPVVIERHGRPLVRIERV